MHKKPKSNWRALLSAFATLILAFMLVPASNSSTSVSYDFNTAGQLTSEFDSYVSSGTISQSSTGGIDNSGAINAPSSANAVFASKDKYSMGAEGSVYTFSSYLKSVFNSGYSGMGFTSLTPSSANASGTPFAPTDALGVSVHGGGFVFHNAGTNFNGSWDSDNSGITTVKKSSINDLLNSGSADDWYKVVVVVTRTAGDTFSLRVEVWPSDDSGDLLRPSEADAIFEKTGLTNNTILNAASISSYINFSGTRVEYFDDYQVNLQGASVIAAGTPVVLTTSSSEASGVISAVGNVTSDGGETVTERGFAISTSSGPTISDTKVVVSGTTGSFSGSSSELSAGTYYLRAFATNSVGTSYGVENSITISGPPSYTVTFDENEGTGSMSSQTASSSQALTSNTFSRGGFSFKGWNTAADGSGTDFSDGASYGFSADVTLYAQWAPVPSSPAPYVGPIPITMDQICVPSTGGTVKVTGKRMSNIHSASVGSTTVEVTAAAEDFVSLEVPELASGSHNIFYESSDGNVTHIRGLRICDPNSEVVEEKPLNQLTPNPVDQESTGLAKTRVTNFSGDQAILPTDAKEQISEFLEENSQVRRLTCVGSTSGVPAMITDRLLARERAQSACDFAANIRPDLNVRILSSVGKGVGSYFRAVSIFAAN